MNKDLDLDDFSKLRNDVYAIDFNKIYDNIDHIAKSEGVIFSTDSHTSKYYAEKKPFIWISRLGVCNRADTLLHTMLNADAYGFDTERLKVRQIDRDIRLIRSLDVLDKSCDINMIMARLEYNLTKAYFRYSSTLRFGLVNPDHLYNTLEEYEVDSVTTKCRQLSDLRVERPNSFFYTEAVTKAFNDSVNEFISSLHPQTELYKKLIAHLAKKNISSRERIKTICNIERCRWRSKMMSGKDVSKKYVEVNIPSFSLRAIKEDEILSMRIGCGTTKTKTPLLTSFITRMDVNPQWFVPKSISKGFAHNYGYMHRMGMFVYDKVEGKLPPERVSYSKLMSGEQYIVQAGGPLNSLGRIIFRFNNNFSVFLHDTSAPWIFQRKKRDISHGCVRVEKPYELALFMFDKDNKELEERLKYSMTVNLANDKDSVKKSKIDKKKLVNSINVKPEVPLFITYYTIYFDNGNQLVEYQDVYDFDEALIKELMPFVK